MFRAAMMGQQYDRQVRPGRLLLDQAQQGVQINAQQGLGGNQQQPRTLFQFPAELDQTCADNPVESRFSEQHQGDLAVTPQRREDDRALGRGFDRRHGLSSPSNGLLAPR